MVFALFENVIKLFAIPSRLKATRGQSDLHEFVGALRQMKSGVASVAGASPMPSGQGRVAKQHAHINP